MSLTKNKKCLLDVGSAYGAVSLCFSCGDNKISHAFDGSYKSTELFKQIIDLNSIGNIKVNRILIGDKTGDVGCVFDTHQSLIMESSQHREKIITLDEYCKINNVIPDVIKIDTEGCEYKVLLGAKEIISSYRPLIFIEVHPNFIKNFHGQSIYDIFKFYEDIDYQAFDENMTSIEDYKSYLENEKSDSSRTTWMPK